MSSVTIGCSHAPHRTMECRDAGVRDSERAGAATGRRTHARKSRRADTQSRRADKCNPEGRTRKSRKADTNPEGRTRNPEGRTRNPEGRTRLHHHDAAGSDWRRSVGSALEQPAICSWAEEGVLLDGREWRCFSHEWRRMAFWCLFYCRGGCCCRCRCNWCCCTKLQEVVLQICRGVGAINQWQWRCWHISD